MSQAVEPSPQCPVQQLTRNGLRKDDPLDPLLLPVRKPVYILLQDHERAQRLAQQLEFFGLVVQALPSTAAFLARSASTRLRPSSWMSTSPARPGLAAGRPSAAGPGTRHSVAVLQPSRSRHPDPPCRSTRRGSGLSHRQLEASSLLEKVELLTNTAPHDPLRVLIIDDSRTQALYTERVLAGAGMLTRSLTDPIRTMAELADFQPDLIILDLYMPACTGPELAKVIRHSDRYVSVPIIYLSAEDDLDKQLDAMSEGGDDFLTKPFRSRHLITTVRNRAARARHLKARMVRDSLTGLYNHTHILQLLEDCSFRARREQQPLSFAMLDIDHFKKINDRHGHPMGDRVIKSLALFLKQRLRKTDFIGRYGGEEFAIVMPIPRWMPHTRCWTKFAGALPKFSTRRSRAICSAPSVQGWCNWTRGWMH